jgi:tRNA A-37 threonylcarbamoyl transferase component Bud32
MSTADDEESVKITLLGISLDVDTQERESSPMMKDEPMRSVEDHNKREDATMQSIMSTPLSSVLETFEENNINDNISTNPAQPPMKAGQSLPTYCDIQMPLKDNSPILPNSRLYSTEESPRMITELVKVNGVSYSRLELIGKGGSSKVYKMMNMQGKIFAMKKVELDGADESMILGYINEITLLNRLKECDSIIKLYDSEIDYTSRCITMVMEYGEIDLAKLLHRQQGKAINENFIRLYWQQMLEAVHAIHEERIVHSDLKPANFLIVEGSLKLIDFGIAKAIQNDTTNIVRENQVRMNYISSNLYSSFPRYLHFLGWYCKLYVSRSSY